MKQFKDHLHQLSVVQIAILIYMISLILGVLFANFFKDSYASELIRYQESAFTEIISNRINYSGLFIYVLQKNIKEFLTFWLLCITILGVPYMIFKVASFGFFTGFFISVISMFYGIKGMLLVLTYIFPHGFIYLPVAILCLHRGFQLCSSIYHDKRYNLGNILQILKPYLIIIILLAAALLIGSFLEAYPGSFLMRKALEIFI